MPKALVVVAVVAKNERWWLSVDEKRSLFEDVEQATVRFCQDFGDVCLQ